VEKFLQEGQVTAKFLVSEEFRKHHLHIIAHNHPPPLSSPEDRTKRRGSSMYVPYPPRHRGLDRSG
jgi:hypothetical protein